MGDKYQDLVAPTARLEDAARLAGEFLRFLIESEVVLHQHSDCTLVLQDLPGRIALGPFVGDEPPQPFAKRQTLVARKNQLNFGHAILIAGTSGLGLSTAANGMA